MDNPVTELLKKALANFGPNGELWGQIGKYGMMREDQYCIVTSISCGVDVGAYGGTAIHSALAQLCKIVRNPPMWNDAPGRTFAEVKEVYLKAIAESEKCNSTI